MMMLLFTYLLVWINIAEIQTLYIFLFSWNSFLINLNFLKEFFFVNNIVDFNFVKMYSNMFLLLYSFIKNYCPDYVDYTMNLACSNIFKRTLEKYFYCMSGKISKFLHQKFWFYITKHVVVKFIACRSCFKHNLSISLRSAFVSSYISTAWMIRENLLRVIISRKISIIEKRLFTIFMTLWQYMT